MAYIINVFRSVLRKLGIVRLLGGGSSMPGKPTIFDVANYFLGRVDRGSGSVMTPLKLQKLCYYAQAWHLAFYGEKLFDGDFEAWPHGPANSELYRKYKHYKWNPIEIHSVPAPKNLTKEQIDLLDEVWDVYGKYDAKYLERLTHQELPWREARGNCEPGDSCSNVISMKTMQKFYAEMLENEEGEN